MAVRGLRRKELKKTGTGRDVGIGENDGGRKEGHVSVGVGPRRGLHDTLGTRSHRTRHPTPLLRTGRKVVILLLDFERLSNDTQSTIKTLECNNKVTRSLGFVLRIPGHRSFVISTLDLVSCYTDALDTGIGDTVRRSDLHLRGVFDI